MLAAKPVMTALWAPRPALRTNVDGKAGMGLRIVLDRRQGVVVGMVVADQHARRRGHRAGQAGQSRDDVAAFVVHGNDDVEFGRHQRLVPTVSTNGRSRSMKPKPNTTASMKL